MQVNKLFIKSLLTIAFCLSSINNNLHAQNEPPTVDLLVGYSQGGVGVNLNYNHFIDRDKYIQGGIYYSKGILKDDNIEVPFSMFTFNAGFFHDVFATRISFFKFSLGGGVTFGSEIVNDGDNQLDNGIILEDRSKIIYGGYLSGEIEIYLSLQLSVVLKANEYYHVNSDLGELTPFFGAGFRYIIY